MSGTMETSVRVDAISVGRRVVEIEARALEQLAEAINGEFAAAVEAMEAAKGRITCAGVGKSGHVARKIAATLASTGAPAQYVHPTEASHGDLGMIAPGDVILALSKSGETQELSDLIHHAKRFGIPLISLTGTPGSTLDRAADIALVIPDAPEACGETRAPTTSTTLMMAMGDALAVALLERRGFTAEHFKTFHPGGKLGAMLRRVSDLMHSGEALPLTPTGTPMGEALEVLSVKGFGCIGVIAPTRELIGIVTDGDIRRLVAQGRMATTIDDAMTRSPVVAHPDMVASAALNLMNTKKITQLFVVAEEKPVGVIHMHDFLKAGVA